MLLSIAGLVCQFFKLVIMSPSNTFSVTASWPPVATNSPPPASPPPRPLQRVEPLGKRLERVSSYAVRGTRGRTALRTAHYTRKNRPTGSDNGEYEVSE
jgi:hypothetical protein